MERNSLARWLKVMILGVGVCGLVVYAYIFPMFGQSLIWQHPELDGWFYPWLIFLWITGVPCYVALGLAWRIAVHIGRDESFSFANARLLKWISALAAGDAMFFFFGNVLYLVVGMNHPGIVIVSLIVVFFGIAISVAASVLSRLVRKAAELQEQNDLTI